MSSQPIYELPKVVHNYCLFMRWLFMIAFIIALCISFQTGLFIDYLASFFMLYLAGQHLKLQILFDRTKIESYNETVNQFNSKSRRFRRSTIREMFQSRKK